MSYSGKSWYDMTPHERAELERLHLKAVADAEAAGPRYCRQTEGHACSSWCGYCGRCCDCSVLKEWTRDDA